LAIFQESKNITQIILQHKEDKNQYAKKFSIIPWNSGKSFEYVVNLNKFTTNYEPVIKHLKENKIEAYMEPNFIEDIFLGTFKLLTNQKVDEKLRKLTKGNLIYFINLKQHQKIIKREDSSYLKRKRKGNSGKFKTIT